MSNVWSAPGQESRRFQILDNVLVILTILSVLVGVLGVVVAFADGDGQSLMIGIAGVGGAITASIGRVLISIARLLDQIGPEVRELRGIAEWQMRQHTSQ